MHADSVPMTERDFDAGSLQEEDHGLVPLVAGPEKAPDRLRALDLFKGVIMVIMALDHVKHGFAGGPGSASGQDPVPFEMFMVPADYSGPASWWLTREVTHLCAVGFAFAMGVGMEFFMKSRSGLGWTWSAFVKYYALRCMVLILLEQCLMWGVSFLIPAIAG